MQQLERDLSLELGIFGKEHLPHPSRRKGADHPIPTDLLHRRLIVSATRDSRSARCGDERADLGGEEPRAWVEHMDGQRRWLELAENDAKSPRANGVDDPMAEHHRQAPATLRVRDRRVRAVRDERRRERESARLPVAPWPPLRSRVDAGELDDVVTKDPSFVDDKRNLVVGLLWWLRKTGVPIKLEAEV